MKRTRLSRTTPMKRGGRLPRTGVVRMVRSSRLQGSPTPRRTRLKPVSSRRRAEMVIEARTRALVLERDGHRCRRCGATGPRLDAAHVLPKGAWPALRFELDNLLCLCSWCHTDGPSAWHRRPKRAIAWATEHLGEDHIARLRGLKDGRVLAGEEVG